MAGDSEDFRPSRRRLPRRGPGRFDETERLPWLEAVDEDDEPIFSDGRRRQLLVVGSVIVVALFGSLLYYVYSQNQIGRSDGGSTIPLITAPEGPTKIEPEDRGGLDVPDQDRLIFDRVTGQDSQIGEDFQGSPEQPLERPQSDPIAQLLQDDTPPPVTDAGIPNQTQPGQAQPSQAQPSQAQPGVIIPRQDVPVASASEPAAGRNTGSLVQNPIDPSSQTISEAETASIVGFRLQLGAFGTQGSAIAAWNIFKSQFPGVLGPLTFELQPVIRPDSPTLYRLRAGVISTRGAADDACNRLRASGQACFVVAP
jgi:SPOR domain